MAQRYSVSGILSGLPRPAVPETITDLVRVEYGYVGTGVPVKIEAPVPVGSLVPEHVLREALTVALRPALGAYLLGAATGIPGHTAARVVGSLDEAVDASPLRAPLVLAGEWADVETLRPEIRVPGGPTVAITGDWSGVRVEVDRRPLSAVVIRDGATARVRASARVSVHIEPGAMIVVDD